MAEYIKRYQVGPYQIGIKVESVSRRHYYSAWVGGGKIHPNPYHSIDQAEDAALAYVQQRLLEDLTQHVEALSVTHQLLKTCTNRKELQAFAVKRGK